jgi:hypothetical protein
MKDPDRSRVLIAYTLWQAVSTLSLLGPLRRAFFGVPFVYQRVTSTTPYTALIATKSAITSMVIVHLDGRLDWMVTQRNALLAWTGHTLSLSPRVNTSMVRKCKSPQAGPMLTDPEHCPLG